MTCVGKCERMSYALAWKSEMWTDEICTCIFGKFFNFLPKKETKTHKQPNKKTKHKTKTYLLLWTHTWKTSRCSILFLEFRSFSSIWNEKTSSYFLGKMQKKWQAFEQMDEDEPKAQNMQHNSKVSKKLGQSWNLLLIWSPKSQMWRKRS